MKEIDCSLGEGGGQVLRTCLALSVITRTPVRLVRIRSRRPRPGLRAQHLKAVESAAEICGGRVAGAKLASPSLDFEPGETRPGRYAFDIGTAGSTALVLQTLLLPLSLAAGESTVRVTGGTHVAWSPPYHYLERHWQPYLSEIGFDIRFELERAGFFPRGGGCVSASVRPPGRLRGLQIHRRGELRRIRGLSAVANLDIGIAERQRRRAMDRLKDFSPDIELEVFRMASPGRGSVLLLLAEFEGSRACFSALGQRGKPAERVADEAAEELREFLATDGAVDPWLADQLLLPLALAPEPSVISTSKVTGHLRTNADVIGLFLPSAIRIVGEEGRPGRVSVAGGPKDFPVRARDVHESGNRPLPTLA